MGDGVWRWTLQHPRADSSHLQDPDGIPSIVIGRFCLSTDPHCPALRMRYLNHDFVHCAGPFLRPA
jgi:hypothetical protein